MLLVAIASLFTSNIVSTPWTVVPQNKQYLQRELDTLERRHAGGATEHQVAVAVRHNDVWALGAVMYNALPLEGAMAV